MLKSFPLLFFILLFASAPSCQAYQIFHLTDLHLDPYYSTSAFPSAHCHPKKTSSSETPCGIFGDGNAYTPDLLINSSLDFVFSLLKTDDFILHTGDVSWFSPTIGRYDEMYGLKLNTLLRERFPHSQIIPSMGNHDVWPINTMGDPQTVSKWVVDETVQAWDTLLDPAAKAQAKIAGYYAITPRPGLCVIVLNSIYFHENNVMVLFKMDAGASEKQLDWFEKTLQSAASQNSTVWIVSHVPFGFHESLLDSEINWAPQITTLQSTNRYLSLIQKYGERISLQVYGHQHTAGFRFVYQNDSHGPLAGVELIGPSITPNDNKHPAMWVYRMSESHELLEIHQYYLNLTEANISKSPQWKLGASWPKDFGMPDLTLKSWAGFASRLQTDSRFLHSVRNVLQLAVNYQSCDWRCYREYLCATLFVHPSQWKNCVEVAH